MIFAITFTFYKIRYSNYNTKLWIIRHLIIAVLLSKYFISNIIEFIENQIDTHL